MTQEIFDNIVEMFKRKFNIRNNNSLEDSYKEANDNVELLKIGVQVETESPWNWVLDFLK